MPYGRTTGRATSTKRNTIGLVRALLQKTQTDMAEAMGVTQPTIANMEKAGKDLKLSSIKRYVESAGAKVRLDIELPDGTHHAIPL